MTSDKIVKNGKMYPHDIELLGVSEDYVIILGNKLNLKWIGKRIVVWSEVGIKNTVHYALKHDKRLVYLCNWACWATESKMTKIKSRVTCKNCIRKMKLEGLI